MPFPIKTGSAIEQGSTKEIDKVLQLTVKSNVNPLLISGNFLANKYMEEGGAFRNSKSLVGIFQILLDLRKHVEERGKDDMFIDFHYLVSYLLM